MLGTNPVAKPQYRTDGALYVKEVFYTIQGEGPRAGQPSVFVRLAGCNLRCYFCDTEFDNGAVLDVDAVCQQVVSLSRGHCQLVVLAGGEPLAQQVLPLVVALHSAGFVARVETAGTCTPPQWAHYSFGSLVGAGMLEIVCSPKTTMLAKPIGAFCRHFKYVVRAGELDEQDGLPVASTQGRSKEARIARPPVGAIVYLQPMADDTPAQSLQNTQAAVAACLKHGYRLSLQQHKIVGVP